MQLWVFQDTSERLFFDIVGAVRTKLIQFFSVWSCKRNFLIDIFRQAKSYLALHVVEASYSILGISCLFLELMLVEPEAMVEGDFMFIFGVCGRKKARVNKLL